MESIERLLIHLDQRQSRNAYLADGTAWVRTVWGGKLLVDTMDLLLAPWLLLDGVWEKEVTTFFQQIVKPNQVFVDVGANIGYFSILAGHLVGWGGRVYAFEAQPETYELLLKSVAANWMTSFVTAERKAVYEDHRTLDFFVRKRHAGNSSLSRPAVSEPGVDEVEKIEVETISLDSYFLGVQPSIDVLKVDVEGSELQVFRGMRGLLAMNRNIVVLCEWSQQQMRDAGNDPAELIEEFLRHDFEIYRVEPELGHVQPKVLLEVPYCNLVLRRS